MSMEEKDLALGDWEQAFDAIPAMICVLDKQYLITRANKAFTEALKLTRQEVIGRPCFRLVHGTEQPHQL